MVVVPFSEHEQKDKPSLQAFVDSIYINVVTVLENGKSMYNDGEFPVYIYNRSTGTYKLIQSKELIQFKDVQTIVLNTPKMLLKLLILGCELKPQD